MSYNQIVSFGLVLILVQATSGQQRCRTPSGSIAECIPFQSCDFLFNMVNRGQQLTASEHKLIVNSWCDPLNGVQMICCPKAQSDSSATESRATDFTTHPNAKLLDLRQCGKSSSNKIGNGLSTEPFEFPWMAMIRTLDGGILEFICGGSLISKRYVLTAAHCMKTIQGPLPIHSVVLGEHDTTTEEDCINGICAAPIQEIPVEQQIPHPKFSFATAKNDIGLLRLQHDAQLSDSVIPVCLPYTIQSQNEKLNKIIVTGWGNTENQQGQSNVLLKAILAVTPVNVCVPIYKKKFDRTIVDSTSLCADGGDSGSCKGDSGGPAVFLGATDRVGPRVFQYGVVSAGLRSCGTNFGIPGLYARVTSYMGWILDNISE